VSTPLERDLDALGREWPWPPTPDLRAAVETRLAERPSPARPRRRRWVIAFAVALALLVPAAAVLGISSGARDSVLRWLGLRGASVERVSALPAVAPPRPLALGTPVPLAAAARRVGFRPLLPTGVGAPDGTFAEGRGPDATLALTYPPTTARPLVPATGVGLLLIELRGSARGRGITKLVAEGTRVRTLTIDGHPAVLFTGSPHVVAFRDARGEERFDEMRLARNALIVEIGGVLVRLEADLPGPALVRLAEGLR
jgi:hypothetical protein